MNIKLLIDTLVRQHMVLIAQLATASGGRTPLAHVADKVFVDLSAELERQGVGRKVVADMFGLALRGYQKRVQRLSASATDRETTLWEALLGYLEERGVVRRTDIMQRFRYDDDAMVRGVLRDQVETGLVFKSGSGPNVIYRLAQDDELRQIASAEDDDTRQIDGFVWLCIYKHGPLPARDIVARHPRLTEAQVAGSLGRLTGDGRVHCNQDTETPVYATGKIAGTLEQAIGWETSVADHMGAVVSTLAASLKKPADAPDSASVGGSTYHFDVWAGHPLEAEVKGQLAALRRTMSDLRSRVDRHNDLQPRPASWQRATLYFGETLAPHNGPSAEDAA
ncbi:MAG: hypothetical protein ACI9MR_000271 [Myxococcota bacterium]|jgi:hypothetical protein